MVCTNCQSINQDESTYCYWCKKLLSCMVIDLNSPGTIINTELKKSLINKITE